jgi:hypothetical protein
MSSCDCVPRVESSHGLEAKSFVFLVGQLALVFLAGCGGGSTNTSGSGLAIRKQAIRAT